MWPDEWVGRKVSGEGKEEKGKNNYVLRQTFHLPLCIVHRIKGLVGFSPPSVFPSVEKRQEMILGSLSGPGQQGRLRRDVYSRNRMESKHSQILSTGNPSMSWALFKP